MSTIAARLMMGGAGAPTPGGPGVMPPPPPGMPPAGAAPPPPAPGQGGGPTSPFARVPGVNPPPPVPGVNPPPPGGAPMGPEFGDVRTGVAMTARAGPADYAGVQQFTDQAYQQARRNLDPMQAQQNRRMQQDLINKGVDPMSEQGKGMLDQMQRQQADQNSKAMFDAMQFGQGVQQQMFGQSLANRQMQNQMTQANIQADIARSGQDLQRYGMDQQFALGRSGQDLQRYGMDQQFALGQSGQALQRYGMDQQYGLGMGQLDVSRQGQDFAQMLGLEGIDFRNRQYADKRSDYQDALTMSLLGMTPVPGAGQFDPSGLAGQMIANSGGGGLLSGLFS